MYRLNYFVLQRSLCLRCPQNHRHMSTEMTALRRSYLYVPSSSDRMLQKSLSSASDMIIYDLEDSVSPLPSDKRDARSRLTRFLSQPGLPDPRRVAVRVNDITTPFFEEDIAGFASSSAVQTLVLPKIHSGADLDYVSRAIHKNIKNSSRNSVLNIVPSIESARASWNLGNIAGWKSEHGPESGGRVTALLFAAEDYCADTSIMRTPSRQELLFTRSQIVIAAKAFGLEAIDMVCVHYKDLDYLSGECVDGRQLGFTGKQAIHPSQVDIIKSTFVPSSQGRHSISGDGVLNSNTWRCHCTVFSEILRAAKILHGMKVAHAAAKGAVGLEGEMIDAPMLKQAEKTITVAMAAGLEIPVLTS